MKLKQLLQGRPNVLSALAWRYGSDKGTYGSRDNGYTRIYEPLFRPLRHQPIRFLELGLLGWSGKRWWTNMEARDEGGAIGAKAPSLQMWLRYFPNAKVVGFDINDFSAVKLDRCTIVQGDMGSRDDLSRVAALGPFDIIIEDASHAWQHQQIALGYLFQHVKRGGIYIVEDLSGAPNKITTAGVPCTRHVLRCAQVTGHFASPLFLPDERATLEREVEAVSLYDSLSNNGGHLDNADALAVIRKR